MQSFGHQIVISSQAKLHIQSKTYLTKVVTFDILIIRHNYAVIWSQNISFSLYHLFTIQTTIQPKNFFQQKLLHLIFISSVKG